MLSTVPYAYEPAHAPPLQVKVPLPVPAGVIVSASLSRLKVAVTDLLELIATVQVSPEVESHPDHPAKVEPVPWVGVRVTVWLSGKEA